MATLSGIITPSNVLTATSTATLTNKTINGSNNTVTNIPLSTGVTGTLPVANGGTGVTSPGTAGNVLTSNGTAWSSTTPAASGFTLGTPIATTSGATAEFTGIPAGVKLVIVSFSDVRFITNAQNILMQLGTSVSYVATGYISAPISFDVAALGFGINPTTSAGLTATAGGTPAERYYGSIKLSLLNASTNLWCWEGLILSDQSRINMTVGKVTITNALTRVKFFGSSANNFNDGSINIMYI
jgi:hypothetical protein